MAKINHARRYEDDGIVPNGCPFASSKDPEVLHLLNSVYNIY